MKIETTPAKSGHKAIYFRKADGSMAFAVGLTTADMFAGLRGMLVIGYRRDCTGGRKGTWTYHFPLFGTSKIGLWRRWPAPFWRWMSVNVFQPLQQVVDTRYAKL